VLREPEAKRDAAMKNDYGDLLEAWKTDLIVKRAKAKGFRRHELPEVQQDVVLAVVGFKFDREKSNGASERTALTAIIDKQLSHLVRTRARRHAAMDRRLHHFKFRHTGHAEPKHTDHEQGVDLQSDVERLMSRLSPTERNVADRLAHAMPRIRIARELGISRYEVDGIVDAIRATFVAGGLDAEALA